MNGITAIEIQKLLPPVIEIAIKAGVEILKVYHNDYNIDIKDDGSPVTLADRLAHELIVAELERLTPNIPVLSEESDEQAELQRASWDTLWIVDPLDGTKQFISKNGEFTVNIALVQNHQPVLGVVHTPAQNTTHFAASRHGAFCQSANGAKRAITVKKFDHNNAIVAASRSHAGTAVTYFCDSLKSVAPNLTTISMGSALKTCLVAEGRADIYPRLGPTSEWDTAAAHCVLTEAGGYMQTVTGHELEYNKPSILNPWFLAFGDASHHWASHCPPPKQSA